jgi:hypothetical protein
MGYPEYDELIELLEVKIKLHSDFMEEVHRVTGNYLDYSKGSIDAYRNVLKFIMCADDE